MRRAHLVAVIILWAASIVSAQEPVDRLKLSGTVVDDDGKAVPGATVLVRLGSPQETFRARTDADGRFALDLPRIFRLNEIDVEPPAGSPLKLWRIDPSGMLREIGRGRTEAEMTFTLRRATGTVTGKVFADDAPVAGARVTLVRVEWFDGGPRRETLETVTDAAGTYRFDGLLVGLYCFETIIPPDGANLLPRRYGTYRYNPHYRPRRLADVGEVTENFHLQSGLRMTGRVVDESGRGVADAKVRGYRAPASSKELARGNATWPANCLDETVTDADGRYVLEGLSSETYAVDATPPGGSSLAPSCPMIGIELSADRTLEDIVLVEGGTLEGTVKDPGGHPVAGARVTLNHQTDSRRITDATGRYRYAGLRTGLYKIQAVPPGGSKWMPLELKRVFALAKVRRAFDLELVEGCAIEGRITDDQGRPVPGVELHSGFHVLARTDDDGRYRVQGLAGENHLDHGARTADVRLRLEPPATSNLLPMKVKLRLTLGETRTHDVALASGGSIRGRVRDARGDGVPFARIHVYTPNARGQPARSHANTSNTYAPWVLTDADGRFVVNGVPVEAVSVRVTPPAERNLVPLVLENVRVESGKVSQVEATLPDGGIVTGIVRDGDGKTMRDMLVELVGPSTSCRTVVTDAAGRYRFDRLSTAKATVAVLARPPGGGMRRYLSMLRPVETTPGRTIELDLTLTRMP